MSYFRLILCLFLTKVHLITSHSILADERCRDLNAVCKDYETSLSCNALQYCLDNDLMSLNVVVNNEDDEMGFIKRLLSKNTDAKSISDPGLAYGQWDHVLSKLAGGQTVQNSAEPMDNAPSTSSGLHFNATNTGLEIQETSRIFRSLFQELVTLNMKDTTGKSLYPWKLNNLPFAWNKKKVNGPCDECIQLTKNTVKTLVNSTFKFAKSICVNLPTKIVNLCLSKVVFVESLVGVTLAFMNYRLFCTVIRFCIADTGNHFPSADTGIFPTVPESLLKPDITDSICDYWPVSEQHECPKELTRLSSSFAKVIASVGKEFYEGLGGWGGFNKMQTLHVY